MHMLEPEKVRSPEAINNIEDNYVSLSTSPANPFTGTLQIPYSGLITRSLSPSLAERLGLDATTRGDVIVDIIPGSPAERLGMRTLNMTRTGSVEEIIASRGDIILAVDGSTSFTTKYRNIEQYIFENKRVGENITLSVLRDGQLKDIEMTIEAMPRFLWYENKDEGIRMKYPSDWIVVNGQSMAGEVVHFHSMERSSISNVPVANVSIIKHPSMSNDTSMALGSVVNNSIKIFRILDINITSLDNSPAYSSIYYDYSQKGNTQKVLTVFAERDSQLYSVDFSAILTRYDDYLPFAREMIKSIQFVG
ncbi:MAG: PDZ domain-containing protein [Nitrososphaeraceae archaeon]|nr:PDZ domain-containing protein [Nitrososphaeraceae archaeon]